jgi:ribonuclease HII
MPRPKPMPDFRFETDLMAAGVRDGRRCRRGRARAAGRAGDGGGGDPRSRPDPCRPERFQGARGGRREALLAELTEVAQIGIGWASVSEIDALNIRNAAFLAMRRAVEALPIAPDHVLVDGNACPPTCPARPHPLVKGDARSVSIAAASIVAKVARDKVMADLDADASGLWLGAECGLSHAGPSRCAATSGGDPAP